MTDTGDSRSQSKLEAMAIEVEKIITEITGQRVSSHETPLDTMGFDSITMLDVLATMEQRFGIALNESIIQEFRTINRIARIVKDEANTPLGDGHRSARE